VGFTTEIDYRLKTGTGLGQLGFKIACVISAKETRQLTMIID
jgi:hypothetical protein